MGAGALAVFGIFGSIHIVEPSELRNSGFMIIPKESWSLSDTFVDLDSFLTGKLFYTVNHRDAATALLRSGIARREELLGPDAPDDPWK